MNQRIKDVLKSVFVLVLMFGAFNILLAQIDTGTRIALEEWNYNVNANGHILFGSTDPNGKLTLDSTLDTVKGYLILNPKGGNVGIGTTTPSTKLEVLGDIKSSGLVTDEAKIAKGLKAKQVTSNGLVESLSGGFKFPDGTVQTTSATSFPKHQKVRFLQKTEDGKVFKDSVHEFNVPKGVNKVWVTISAGGGGGGSGPSGRDDGYAFGGGGGGAQSAIAQEIKVTPESIVVVVVGSGGMGGEISGDGTDGSNGGNSKFGNFIVNGGKGGNRYIPKDGDDDISSFWKRAGGTKGGFGGNNGVGFFGGDSMFGSSGMGFANNGAGYGSGGNGSLGNVNGGGNGAAGFVLVEW